MKETDYFITLVHKQLSGQLSAEEAEILGNWLNESEEHRQLCEEISFTWELAGRDSLKQSLSVSEEEVNAEAERLHKFLHQEEVKKVQPSLFANWMKISAIFLLLALSAFAGFYWRAQGEVEPISPFNFQLAEGRLEAWLPDSSFVAINHHSSFSLLDFKEERVVRLKGEAFFEVRKDQERPFYIYLEKAVVKVVGTSFVISAYPGKALEVGVLEGKVEVSFNDQTISLTEGEQVRIGEGKGLKSGQLNPNLMAWKTRKLVFTQLPLSEVFPILESYYGIQLQAQNAELLNCRFTGSFRDIPLHDLLEILSYGLELEVERSGKTGFILSGEGCKGGGA